MPFMIGVARYFFYTAHSRAKYLQSFSGSTWHGLFGGKKERTRRSSLPPSPDRASCLPGLGTERGRGPTQGVKALLLLPSAVWRKNSGHDDTPPLPLETQTALPTLPAAVDGAKGFSSTRKKSHDVEFVNDICNTSLWAIFIAPFNSCKNPLKKKRQEATSCRHNSQGEDRVHSSLRGSSLIQEARPVRRF